MTEDEELEHASDLLREAMDDGWDGRTAAVIPIDHECSFADCLQQRCGRPLAAAVCLKGEEQVFVLALCQQHADVTRRALQALPSPKNALTAAELADLLGTDLESEAR